MSVPTAERVEGKRRRLQVGLRDMTLWVVGAAVFFALARGARGFWFDLGTPTRREMLDIDRTVGVALLAPATLIALRLLLDAIRPRGEGAGGGFASVWRLAGVAFLAGMAILMSGIARDDRSALTTSIFERPQWRIKLAALGLAIGTIGLLLGVVPARRPRPVPSRRRWVLPSVILAGLAGVALVAFWRDSLIVYLILVALDAVSHAMMRPGLAAGVVHFGQPSPPILRDPSLWPSFDHRLATAGIRAAVAFLACSLAAGWLARDLRASREERDQPRSWAGLIYRIITTLAAFGMGAYLLFVAVPALHPQLVEGLWWIIGPTWAATTVATFLALAAGIAARGVAGPLDDEAQADPPPLPRWFFRVRWLALWLLKSGLVLALVLAILGAVGQFITPSGEGLPWWAPVPVAVLVDALGKPFEWATSTAIYLDPNATPDALYILGAVVVLVVLALRLLLATPRAAGLAPIDRIGSDPRLIGRFLGDWLAMAGVMLSLLPAFFLAGMAALHVAMKTYYG
jgi:hypothetical protein